MHLTDILRSNWIIPIVIVVMVLYGAWAVFYMKNLSKKKDKWFNENPSAAKVIIDPKSKGVIQNSITIDQINDNKPTLFYEKSKTVLGLLPGTYVITSTFSSTRPGLLHKTITETYGPTKQEITVEAGKTYIYTFDKEEGKYSFYEQGK